MHRCACLGVCAWVCVFRCVCTGMRVQMCVHRCACTGVRAWVCVHRCVCAAVCTRVCVCRCVCVHDSRLPSHPYFSLQVDQSGLGLPSRDYYLNKTENEKVSVPLPREWLLPSPPLCGLSPSVTPQYPHLCRSLKLEKHTGVPYLVVPGRGRGIICPHFRVKLFHVSPCGHSGQGTGVICPRSRERQI